MKKEDNLYRGPVRTPVDFSKHLTMAPPPEGVACGHPGCLHHISHPCECCGRIGGRRKPTREQIERDFHENPHRPIYWAPSETWDEAVAREVDFRYEKALAEWQNDSIKK